jgi:hypothetical protein
MKLRRVAISIAATTALALGGATSALAETEVNYEDFEGNATTCSGGQNPAGLDGELLIGGDEDASDSTDDVSGTVTDKKYLNIEVHNDDLVIYGIVIKAGDGYRIYYSPEPDMHGPLVGQDKNVPTISHWFLCGEVPPPGNGDDDDNGKKDDDNGEEQEDENGDKEPEKTVPTAVPAGYGDTGSGVAGLVGLLAAFAAAIAAGALLIRRRLLNEN